MTTDERIVQWECEKLDGKHSLHPRDVPDLKKYDISDYVISINNAGILYIHNKEMLPLVIIRVFFNPDFSYSIEVSVDKCSVLGKMVGYDKYPISSNYYNIIQIHGWYYLNKNYNSLNKWERIKFIKNHHKCYIDKIVPEEFQPFIDNPLWIMQDDDIDNFMDGIIKLYAMDGNEIYRYQANTISIAFDTIKKAASINSFAHNLTTPYINDTMTDMLNRLK